MKRRSEILFMVGGGRPSTSLRQGTRLFRCGPYSAPGKQLVDGPPSRTMTKIKSRQFLQSTNSFSEIENTLPSSTVMFLAEQERPVTSWTLAS